MNCVDETWSDTAPLPSDTRLGVFGGTFDPPHIGHCIVAQELHFQLRLDRVLFVAAGTPPHKPSESVTPGSIRIEMLRAAVAADGRFEISDIELNRGGPSYTVDTLRQLSRSWPGAELFLGLGADQLAEFESWRDPEEIADLATVVGFGRAGESPVGWSRWATELISIPGVELSSTDIRSRIREGVPVRYLLPDGVEEIIRREGLYR